MNPIEQKTTAADAAVASLFRGQPMCISVLRTTILAAQI
jgi:hypothetical protein